MLSDTAVSCRLSKRAVGCCEAAEADLIDDATAVACVKVETTSSSCPHQQRG